MYIDRLEEYSIKYWLDSLFSAYPHVSIVTDYPDENLVLPTVAVYNGNISLHPEQLGTRKNKSYVAWYIDIFAKNKAQRDEFATYIYKELENRIPVFDYNEGFPPSVTPTQIGTIDPIDIVVRPVRIFPELVEKMYYRTTIGFLTIRTGG